MFRIVFFLLAALCSSCQTPVPETDSDVQAFPMLVDPAYVDPLFPPSLEEISIESDGARMSGRFYLANGEGPHPTVLLLHGYPGTETNLDIAQMLRRAGYNVLFIHYRGAWGSEGDYAIAHLGPDAAAAIAWLRANNNTRVDKDKIILIGHSMGGFAAFMAAAEDPHIVCVVGWAPADLGIVATQFDSADAAAGFASYTDDLVMLGGVSGASVVDDIKEHRVDYDIASKARALSGKHILLVGAEDDAVLPVDQFHERLTLAFGANPEVDLTSIVIDGDHGFSWTRVALGNLTRNWLNKTCN